MAELFETYEINRKRRWPRVARWLVASFALHFVLVAVLLYGPSLYALWRLANLAAGAEYADEDYTLGQIKERAVMVTAGDKLLLVPPDYLPKEPPPEVLATPEPTPPPAPTPSPTPMSPEDIEQQRSTLETVAQVTGVPLPPRINPRPFKDLLKKWADEYEKGHLDLKGNIEVTVMADRQEDGTLTNMEMTAASGDSAVLKKLAEDVALTLSASHALAFLQGAKRVKMVLALNQQKLSVKVSSTMESPSRAASVASVYGIGLTLERARRSGTDEGEVWKNTSITSQGNDIVVNFEMTREEAGSLLAKQVEKVKTEP
jgi:hypothetical protein